MNAHRDPAFEGAFLFHGMDLLPQLRALPREHLSQLAKQASEHSNTAPLYMQPYASSQEFPLPALDPLKKYSGVQVITVMVLSLWVMQGEREELCEPLLGSWPLIRDITTFCNAKAQAQT